MANLNDSPALWAIYHTTQAIEGLGCGEAFTAAAVQSSEALRLTQAEVDRRIAAERALAEARDALATSEREADRLAMLLDNAAALEGELRDNLADASDLLGDFVAASDCMSLTPSQPQCPCTRCRSRALIVRLAKRLARTSPAPTTPTTETT
jgi:hypothetical protein